MQRGVATRSAVEKCWLLTEARKGYNAGRKQLQGGFLAATCGPAGCSVEHRRRAAAAAAVAAGTLLPAISLISRLQQAPKHAAQAAAPVA